MYTTSELVGTCFTIMKSVCFQVVSCSLSVQCFMKLNNISKFIEWLSTLELTLSVSVMQSNVLEMSIS